jgi:hypothetical protein
MARAIFGAGVVSLLGLFAFTAPALDATAQPRESKEGASDLQKVLAPGLYLLQTRTRKGSCDDAPRTGYVTSAMATLDGVPGSRQMTLQVMNSKWWPSWSLTVEGEVVIRGSAVMFGGTDPSKGSSSFEIRPYKDRFQGVGTREYPHGSQRCTLDYDVLLKRID